jgi:hypothetical protein
MFQFFTNFGRSLSGVRPSVKGTIRSKVHAPLVNCGALVFYTALNLKPYFPLLNLDFGKAPTKKFVWTELKLFTHDKGL